MDTFRVGPVINGRMLDDGGGGVADVFYPASGEVAAQQACCDTACVDAIVQSASDAYHSPAWQQLTPADRGRLLLKLADLLEAEAERFIELELLDTGKPIAQLRGGEIPLSAALLRFYAGAADKIDGSMKNTPGGFHMTMFEPYGVVAGILPWNYPFVNAALKVAPALAAGNTIVLKPSVETPLATVEFAKLCTRAGIPDGAVNVVLGSGSRAGQALITHPLVKKISFTGSTSVGQAIQRSAADQMKAVNLECGGKNAIVVFDDAHLERAADAALFSGFVNAGQLCVSCSRLLVQKAIARDFEAILAAKMKRLRAGDPRDEGTLIGPMITKSQHEIAWQYLASAKQDGCRMITGESLGIAKELGGGYWMQPTLLCDVKPGMKVADEEIFGPVLSMMTFEDQADAIRIANSVCYGLSGSVWTSNVDRAGQMVRAMDTGIIWVNTMLVGYPQIPVPPHKMSGTGVELGMEGLLAYCKRKSAVIAHDSSGPVGWSL